MFCTVVWEHIQACNRTLLVYLGYSCDNRDAILSRQIRKLVQHYLAFMFSLQR